MSFPIKRGQKNVPSTSIQVGDQIFRSSKDRGDLMLVVKSVSRGTHKGVEVCIWGGDVYQLDGYGSGPDAKFLGAITGRRIGTGEWKMPADNPVTKGVPADEADWSY